MLLSCFAPAKVNLFLHVGPVKPNGRHDLDSLVVFSDEGAGDHLTVDAADALSLTVTGMNASAAGPIGDNLVFRAAAALQAASGSRKGARMILDKRLPVAAGIGGGSSDAAAVLRLLTDLWGTDPALAADLAATLGGDVPVALNGVPAMMRGEGERVSFVSLPFRLPALLVNPGVACPTGPVFRAFDAGGGGAAFAETGAVPEFADADQLLAWLSAQRNDLEAPALSLLPEIAEVLSVLRQQDGAQLVRMSGSGATCFAVFGAMVFAQRAAAAINARRPDWWIAACRLGAG